VEVHGSIKGDVVIEEGFPQDSDEVAAHGKQDVGVQEGDTGSRSPGDDDAHKGGLCDSSAGGCEGIIWGESRGGINIPGAESHDASFLQQGDSHLCGCITKRSPGMRLCGDSGTILHVRLLRAAG